MSVIIKVTRMAWTVGQLLADRRIEDAVRAAVLTMVRLFYKIRIVGADRVPKDRGVLFVCNQPCRDGDCVAGGRFSR